MTNYISPPGKSDIHLVIACTNRDLRWTVEHALSNLSITIRNWSNRRTEQAHGSAIWVVCPQSLPTLFMRLLGRPKDRAQMLGMIVLSLEGGDASLALELRDRGAGGVNIDIRLLTLPFTAEALRNMVLDFVEHLSMRKPEPKKVLSLRAFVPCRVLRRARSTLGLEITDVVRALESHGVLLGTETYEAIERGEKEAQDIGMSLWSSLCQVLELCPEVLSSGYSVQEHLARIRAAIASGRFLFPVGAALLAKLQQESFHSPEKPRAGLHV